LWRTIKISIVVLFIAGLLHLSGIYQTLFYSKTSDRVQQKVLESLVQAETLTVPISVFIVSGNENLGSERNADDVSVMVEKASRIWNQAKINITLVKVKELKLSEEEINVFYQYPGEFLNALPEFDINLTTVMLIKHLRGINGLAFGGARSIAVADYTASYDFRVFAHEVGHILGLEHVSSKSSLMYSGSNGVLLSMEEVLSARETAELYFSALAEDKPKR